MRLIISAFFDAVYKNSTQEKFASNWLFYKPQSHRAWRMRLIISAFLTPCTKIVHKEKKRLLLAHYTSPPKKTICIEKILHIYFARVKNLRRLF